MFLTALSLLCIVPSLLAFGCNATCPVNSGTRCLGDYCSGSYKTGASCDGGYCRCHQSALYDDCTCLPHVSGCLIKRSPSTYVGLPSTDGSPETVYGCVSTATNFKYEVHVIANYESSNGRHGSSIKRVAGNTYVNVNINGQSSKPLILVFTSYEPVNWRLSLPSGVVNRILLSGFYTSKVFGYSNVEVVSRDLLRFGYGSDGGGGDTSGSLVYLTKRFGPISSFSGSYRADRWTVNINRSPDQPTDRPSTNTPSTNTPFTDRPFTMPSTNTPFTDRPFTNMPSTNTPFTDRPSTNTPSTNTPFTDRPSTNTPSTNTPSTNMPFTDRPSTNTPFTNRPFTDRPFTFRPFTNRPSESTSKVAERVIGVIGGIVTALLTIALLFYVCLRICVSKSQATGTHVMQHTAPNGNSSSRPVATQPHPPTITAFNLPRPEPVAVNITQPHTCLSITEAPPPTYNLHETFSTYNEPSEAPPPYQPPTYDVATKCGPLNFPQD